MLLVLCIHILVVSYHCNVFYGQRRCFARRKCHVYIICSTNEKGTMKIYDSLSFLCKDVNAAGQNTNKMEGHSPTSEGKITALWT